MKDWTEAQAAAFFASGGTDEPAPNAGTSDDLVLDEEDFIAAAPAAAVPPAPVPAEEEDLVIDGDDLEQPVFQSGGDTSMIAREVDKETAAAGLEAPPSAIVAPTAAPPPAGGAASSGGRPQAKAVLVGNSGVGKTSLMMRFSENRYVESSKATIGVDLHTREVELPSGGSLSLQLWDTAGQEQFQSLTSSYFRQAHCVVMAYDVHDPPSFAALAKWMMEVDRHGT